jgi:hypothetical protein
VVYPWLVVVVTVAVVELLVNVLTEVDTVKGTVSDAAPPLIWDLENLYIDPVRFTLPVASVVNCTMEEATGTLA